MQGWRGSLVGLLVIVHTGGILLAMALGHLLPTSGQVAFLFGHTTIHGLYLLDVQRHLAAQLARGTSPLPNYTWSPDGKQLAYVAQINDRPDILLTNIECASVWTPCSQPVNLTHQRESDTEPAWSPDGSGIAFVTERSGAAEIYWRPVSGDSAYNLTQDSATDSFPVWSPDGHYIAFYSDRSGFLEVYVMNMNCLRQIASCPKAIHRLGGGFNSLPAWSPDGQQLAYFVFGDLLLAQTKCLVLSDNCGQQAYNLTHSPYTDWYPVWSPDSQTLLFQSNRNSQSQVFEASVHCDSTQSDCATPLQSTLSYSLYPSFSPDGRQVLLQSLNHNSQELYVVAIDGRTVQQLTNMGGQISSARWRPLPP